MSTEILSILTSIGTFQAVFSGALFSAFLGLSGLHLSLIAFLIMGLRQSYSTDEMFRRTASHRELGGRVGVFVRLEWLLKLAAQNGVICLAAAMVQFLGYFDTRLGVVGVLAGAVAVARFIYFATTLWGDVQDWLADINEAAEARLKEMGAA